MQILFGLFHMNDGTLKYRQGFMRSLEIEPPNVSTIHVQQQRHCHIKGAQSRYFELF